jgi:hypothetical protein
LRETDRASFGIDSKSPPLALLASSSDLSTLHAASSKKKNKHNSNKIYCKSDSLRLQRGAREESVPACCSLLQYEYRIYFATDLGTGTGSIACCCPCNRALHTCFLSDIFLLFSLSLSLSLSLSVMSVLLLREFIR